MSIVHDYSDIARRMNCNKPTTKPTPIDDGVYVCEILAPTPAPQMQPIARKVGDTCPNCLNGLLSQHLYVLICRYCGCQFS